VEKLLWVLACGLFLFGTITTSELGRAPAKLPISRHFLAGPLIADGNPPPNCPPNKSGCKPN
jgi:hypothetical protein